MLDSMLGELDLDAIAAARVRIAPHVVRTPLLRHALRGDCELLLKPESLQPTGAFKLRGAFSMMTTLPRGCPGVVAHSSGNHAQAVARAARVLGLRAVIVMPADVTALKRARTEADGAEVVLVDPDSDERERRAAEIARERGFVPVPPYDHPLVAAGQGTAALELLEDAGGLDRFYAPISGGGLMAGCAVAIHGLEPGVELVGVEPEDANDTRLSLAAGERRTVPPPRTLADGLRMRTPGALTWPVLQKHLARVELVSDEEMLDAMAFALRSLRLVLEPSGAASLAAALREGRGRCGVLLSGGNAEPALLAEAARRAAG
jgi:threonine dehydratase